jgi:hypothetical protein
MKNVIALGLASGLLSLAAGPAIAQGPAMPQPTSEHALLAQDVGEWTATVKMWMGPGDPVESTGTETVSMRGPFWQVADFKGNVMGQDFEGTGWTGWDAEKKQYVGVWIDSMTPGIAHGTATWDPAAKTFNGSMESMGPDGRMQTMETSVSYPNEGTRVFTMKTDDQTTMEITYTRK